MITQHLLSKSAWPFHVKASKPTSEPMTAEAFQSVLNERQMSGLLDGLRTFNYLPRETPEILKYGSSITHTWRVDFPNDDPNKIIGNVTRVLKSQKFGRGEFFKGIQIWAWFHQGKTDEEIAFYYDPKANIGELQVFLNDK